ncbi:hypothetical protein [Streptomyces sp. NBC_01304]|uniref:hypothetical protein n=1 Tax=Streptomyces sp. NBC_01304 TaxID=2903818 RepID=UPI002E128270|nr:EcsC family protein [Streptomyces sp. NBC_01304]
MTGSTPPRKKFFRKRHADGDLSMGARDGERGLPASLEAAGDVDGVSTDITQHSGHSELAEDTEIGPSASPTARPGRLASKKSGDRLASVKAGVRTGVRKGGQSAKAGIGYLADRIIENAPRIPVRDLTALQKQFPGLGPEQIADKLITGASAATSTVGAGVGAAAMLPVPPAMPAELAAEITGVAAIELKLIAELHEVYGLRPPGNLKQRTTAYLTAWSQERGIDVAKPSTLNAALGGQMKRELRQQIMKRMVRNLPNLMPFMVGAAIGAVMNRRDTKKLAAKVRKDLQAHQVPWDALPELAPLEPVKDPLDLGRHPRELGQ